MIAIDLSKQKALDADLRAIQQINFSPKLDRAGNTTKFLITEEAKETFFGLFTRNRKRFANAKCDLIFICIKWHNTTA